MWGGRCLLVGACSACLAFMLASAAYAQNSLSRPIEIIVPWGSGGGSDQLARKIAGLLEPKLKVPIRVTNMPGGGGNKGLAHMLAADPDGYTLSIMTADTFASLATRRTDWRLADIRPLAILSQQPSAFLVHEQSKYKTWADLETAAKNESVRVAISGQGTPDELTVTYLTRKGLRFITVPIAKPGERQLAILGGSVDVLYEQIGDVRSLVQNNQLRPVLLFAERRDPRFKTAPTSLELGYKIKLPQFRMLVAKAGADSAAMAKLGGALAEAAASPEYAAHLMEQYADEKSFLPGDEALTFLESELSALNALVAEQNAMVGR